MNAALNQILGLFEQDPELTPAQIGEALKLDPGVVDSCLRIHCPLYRELRGAADLEEPTQEQAIKQLKIDAEVVASLQQQLVTSALTSDNESLRVKAAKYLIEEATGRNHARAFRQNKTVINNNITAINARFHQLKAARSKVNIDAPPVIESQPA